MYFQELGAAAYNVALRGLGWESDTRSTKEQLGEQIKRPPRGGIQVGFREALPQEEFLVMANHQSLPACEDGQQ